MMIEIDGKVISTEIFRRRFVCDIRRCKGTCCYDGDSGAPLEEDELRKLEDALPAVRPLLNSQELDGDLVTPIINGRECVYSNREADGTWTCAIEKAFLAGKTAWRKPISCHLYPIRIKKYKRCETLNFHEWDVCKPALELGEKIGKPVYQFLKEPLIAKYGERFFRDLEQVEDELKRQNVI